MTLLSPEPPALMADAAAAPGAPAAPVGVADMAMPWICSRSFCEIFSASA
jgi:hypothetical protein